MVNVSANAKPIKNIKMANSNTRIGNIRSPLCFYLFTYLFLFIYVRFRVPQSAGWVCCISRHISWSSDSEVVGFHHTQRFFVINIEQV